MSRKEITMGGWFTPPPPLEHILLGGRRSRPKYVHEGAIYARHLRLSLPSLYRVKKQDEGRVSSSDRGLNFWLFFQGGVLDAHLHAHYREGIPPPENQVIFDSDPLSEAKFGNGPGGTFYPISFNWGEMAKNGLLENCRGHQGLWENTRGGPSEPLDGAKNGFLWAIGGELVCQLELLFFPPEGQFEAAVQRVKLWGDISEVKMTNVI